MHATTLICFIGLFRDVRTFAQVQTAFSVNLATARGASVTKSPVPTATFADLPPPCCWVAGGSQAVSFNTWYNETYTDTVATAVTTFLQYHDTMVVANSSTRYANATWSGFGLVGGNFNWYGSVLPSVSTDLIPTWLMDTGEYGATSIYHAAGTNVVTLGDTVMYGSHMEPRLSDRCFPSAVHLPPLLRYGSPCRTSHIAQIRPSRRHPTSNNNVVLQHLMRWLRSCNIARAIGPLQQAFCSTQSPRARLCSLLRVCLA
jgi:hypothetical protein